MSFLELVYIECRDYIRHTASQIHFLPRLYGDQTPDRLNLQASSLDSERKTFQFYIAK